MSIAVELEELRARVAEHGPVALLVTVNADGAPHVVSVVCELRGEQLAAVAGKTTVANVEARPAVTVVWPTVGDYCLIVDGPAVAGPGEVTIEPVRAVLHRVAGASGDGPSCVTVIDRR